MQLFVVGAVGTRIEPEPSPCSSRHAHMGIAQNIRHYSCVQQAIIARESLPNSLGCREAPTVNMSFLKPENLEDASLLEVEAPEAPEANVSFRMKRSRLKKMAVGVATAMVVCVGIFALSTNGFSRNCSNVGTLQGKSSLDLDSAIRTTSEKLIQAAKNNQTLADETVMKAMVKAGHKVQDHWEKHHTRKLDTLVTIRKVKGFRQGQKAELAGIAECSFNILEAFVSVVGMGDDINAIIRTCPAPRDGESELACQVNGAILGAWVGNLATKLALAASNCALSINVDAILLCWHHRLGVSYGRDCSWSFFGCGHMHRNSATIDHHQDQCLGRSDCPRWPTFADWRRRCGQRCAVWCGCRHGGSQHCKPGACHQQGRECEQVQSQHLPLTVERVQGHPRITLHR